MVRMKSHLYKVEPYVPGFQPDGKQPNVKLNQNENPYPPSPRVEEALKQVSMALLQKYPDSRCGELRQTLAEQYHVGEEQVLCGNGSDEIISLIFKAFIPSGSSIVLPYPTYSLYPVAGQLHDVRPIHIQTRHDFTIPADGLISTEAEALFLVNPNAPTGLLLSLHEVERVVKSFKGLVIIDEAYMDFAVPNASAVQLTRRCDNLVVMRTFSKSYSLCGARVGYCFAHHCLIEALDSVRDSFNVNSVSQVLALAAMKDQNYMQTTAAKIRSTRDAFTGELRNLGWDVLSSQANFVLCTPKDREAEEIYAYLMQHRIYVRYFRSPRLYDKLRISIGTDEMMEKLLAFLK